MYTVTLKVDPKANVVVPNRLAIAFTSKLTFVDLAGSVRLYPRRTATPTGRAHSPPRAQSRGSFSAGSLRRLASAGAGQR